MLITVHDTGPGPADLSAGLGDAHELAFAARVVAVAPDPDTPLPVAGVVTAQAPGAGTRVDPADPVAILVDPRGGGGRPLTPPPPGPRDPAGSKPTPEPTL